MWIWRRMENISWTEHITVEEMLARIGEERTLIHTIRKRQRKWIGQILVLNREQTGRIIYDIIY